MPSRDTSRLNAETSVLVLYYSQQEMSGFRRHASKAQRLRAKNSIGCQQVEQAKCGMRHQPPFGAYASMHLINAQELKQAEANMSNTR